MKRFINKAIFLFLAVLLALSFTACGGTDKESKAPVPTASAVKDGVYTNGKYGFSMDYNNKNWAAIDNELLADAEAKAEFMECSVMTEDLLIEQLKSIECYFSYKHEETSGFKSNVNIVILPDSDGTIFEMKNKDNVKYVEDNLIDTFESIGLGSELREESIMRKFGDTEYLVIQMSATAPGLELWMYQASTIIDRNAITVTFASTPEIFDDVIAEIDNMITSLKFY